MTLRAVVMMALVVACAAPVFSAGNVVTIEKGGRLLLNGKRFFPLGLYAKPSGADPYKQMAEAGFNLVSSGFDVQALEAAAKAGVYCWIPLGEAADLSGDREKRESRLREIVTGAKAHPALLMYESVDEPAWTWNEPAKARVGADGLALGYRLVKSLDPNHPVTMNHAPQNTVETLRKYNAACDTVSVDIYPIVPRDILYMYGLTRDGRHGDLRNQTPSCVGEYVDKMRKVAGPDRPVWMVLQGFAWAALDEEAKVQSSIVYPSFEQTRYMAWQSVIHGCNGIIYWGTYTIPQPGDCWEGIKRVVRELADLHDVLVADEAPAAAAKDYDEMGYSIDLGVETSARDAGGYRYLLAANSGIDPAGVTFGKGVFKDGEVDVLGESRKVEVKDGTFHDTFKALGVHIYRGRKP